MKVKLIQITQDPIDVMWTAARTCYASESPVDMWEDKWGKLDENKADYPEEDIVNAQEKHWKLVQKVLNSGHQSIAEHVYFTFAIEGISRACSHQLVRHRHCTFSQQSQRYVEIKESYEDLCNVYEGAASTARITDKYFVPCNDGMSGLKYAELATLKEYRRLIEEEEMKPEDARAILPNATLTNITMSYNYRELIHMCHLRLCTRAQKEIRDLFKEIVKQVKEQEPKLAQYLVPQCEVWGVCTEDKCCGRKPKLEDVMQIYNNWKKENGNKIQ